MGDSSQKLQVARLVSLLQAAQPTGQPHPCHVNWRTMSKHLLSPDRELTVDVWDLLDWLPHTRTAKNPMAL